MVRVHLMHRDLTPLLPKTQELSPQGHTAFLAPLPPKTQELSPQGHTVFLVQVHDKTESVIIINWSPIVHH